MKIVYFYQYFSTPKGSWGTRVYEFARNWVEQGHDVTVVTGIYSKSDLKAEKLVEDQLFEGIKVKILNVKIDNKQSVLKRIWTFIQYTVLSIYYALTLPADVVIASSGPITVGIPGLVAKYVRGRKLVFEVRDLWPLTAIEMDILKNKHMIMLAYWLERKCYFASSHIIALSPGMKENIKKRFGLDNITSVTNSANIPLFSTPVTTTRTPLQKEKYAIYTGNIGEINNSLWLLEAAKILKSIGREDIKIVLIGEGPQREYIEEQIKVHELNNLIRIGLMPKTDLVAFIQNAMVSLVPLKGKPTLDTSSPNKFFESLAAGVPIVQNTNGWMKTFLDDNQVGFTLNPEDPKALADLLIELSESDMTLYKERCYSVSQQFDKDLLADKMLKALTGEKETYAFAS